MRRGYCRQRTDGSLDAARVRRRKHPTAVEPAHTVSEDVRLLSGVEAAIGQRGIDLVEQLPAAILNSTRGIENWRDHLVALRG